MSDTGGRKIAGTWYPLHGDLLLQNQTYMSLTRSQRWLFDRLLSDSWTIAKSADTARFFGCIRIKGKAPSQRKLAARYGIAQPTLNKELQLFCESGLLEECDIDGETYHRIVNAEDLYFGDNPDGWIARTEETSGAINTDDCPDSQTLSAPIAPDNQYDSDTLSSAIASSNQSDSHSLSPTTNSAEPYTPVAQPEGVLQKNAIEQEEAVDVETYLLDGTPKCQQQKAVQPQPAAAEDCDLREYSNDERLGQEGRELSDGEANDSAILPQDADALRQQEDVGPSCGAGLCEEERADTAIATITNAGLEAMEAAYEIAPPVASLDDALWDPSIQLPEVPKTLEERRRWLRAVDPEVMLMHDDERAYRDALVEERQEVYDTLFVVTELNREKWTFEQRRRLADGIFDYMGNDPTLSTDPVIYALRVHRRPDAANRTQSPSVYHKAIDATVFHTKGTRKSVCPFVLPENHPALYWCLSGSNWSPEDRAAALGALWLWCMDEELERIAVAASGFAFPRGGIGVWLLRVLHNYRHDDFFPSGRKAALDSLTALEVAWPYLIEAFVQVLMAEASEMVGERCGLRRTAAVLEWEQRKRALVERALPRLEPLLQSDERNELPEQPWAIAGSDDWILLKWFTSARARAVSWALRIGGTGVLSRIVEVLDGYIEAGKITDTNVAEIHRTRPEPEQPPLEQLVNPEARLSELAEYQLNYLQAFRDALTHAAFALSIAGYGEWPATEEGAKEWILRSPRHLMAVVDLSLQFFDEGYDRDAKKEATGCIDSPYEKRVDPVLYFHAELCSEHEVEEQLIRSGLCKRDLLLGLHLVDDAEAA